MCEHSVKALKRRRVDAMYGKKKHFNGSERQQCINSVLSWASIILSALTSVSLLSDFKELMNPLIGDILSNNITFIMSLTLTIVLAAQKTFKYKELSEKNHQIGCSYLEITKEIDNFLSFIEDGIVNEAEIKDQLLGIQKKINEIDKLAKKTKLRKIDYRKAKEGLESGEETYTSEELDNWQN